MVFEKFTNKEFASITIQGVLIASSVLYLKHEGPNLLIILAIAFILCLFVLQAINHRFYYYFPGNKFAHEQTKDIDTYILYLLTFLAFLCFLWGVSHSLILSICLTVFTVLPGFFWKIFMYKRVRQRITNRLRNKNYIQFIECPYCGAKAIRGRRIFRWNKGYQIIECLEGCKKRSESYISLKIG